MKKLFNLSFLLVAGILLLSGCAKYNAHKLAEPVGVVHQTNNVEVKAEALTDADCHYYFSRRALSKGYQPIQLCIKNGSNQNYILKANNIDLQIESRKNVARSLQLNTTGRVVGWGLPGLIAWPFFIPAAVEGVKASDANKKLNDDFNQRVLNNDSRIVIAPGSSINKVFFVMAENFKNKFDITLENKRSKESISFKIKL